MNETGLIFDIQRASLHDGPGIRTTVFFKGCPLRCQWCHNPESRSYRLQVSFQSEKCIHCLSCLKVCRHGAQQAEAGVHGMDHKLCLACGDCLPHCPQQALTMIGEERSVEQIMAVVIRDSPYYEASGGGITLSGGEPMAQFDFALGILRACKEAGIHTCMETSGFASQWKYREIQVITDMFLFDYKATTSETHFNLTGVSNDLILANMEYLYNHGAPILLRCPLIPGINDTMEHLEGISRISRKYPDLIGIELMPYHNWGRDKSRRLGQAYPLEAIQTAHEAAIRDWRVKLASLGCLNLVG